MRVGNGACEGMMCVRGTMDMGDHAHGGTMRSGGWRTVEILLPQHGYNFHWSLLNYLPLQRWHRTE